MLLLGSVPLVYFGSDIVAFELKNFQDPKLKFEFCRKILMKISRRIIIVLTIVRYSISRFPMGLRAFGAFLPVGVA